MRDADLEIGQSDRLEADNGAGNTALGSVDQNLNISQKGEE